MIIENSDINNLLRSFSSVGSFSFMMAASHNKSDLDAVNYLLRRCPQVLVNTKGRAEENIDDHQSGSQNRQREE